MRTAAPCQDTQRRTGRRLAATVAAGGLGLLWLGAAPASAHQLTVTPQGAAEPVVDQPVSHAWAQAHCHAASPGTTHETSEGTVVFTPQGAFSCPDVENPGGQVHPHAGEG